MTALAYHEARTRRGDAPPSIAPLSRWDLVRLVELWLPDWKGLAAFLHHGIVVTGVRRG